MQRCLRSLNYLVGHCFGNRAGQIIAGIDPALYFLSIHSTEIGHHAASAIDAAQHLIQRIFATIAQFDKFAYREVSASLKSKRAIPGQPLFTSVIFPFSWAATVIPPPMWATIRFTSVYAI